jgi:hypothetical protein
MVIKTNKLIMHTETAAVCSEINIKKNSTPSEHHVDFFLNFKPGGT